MVLVLIQAKKNINRINLKICFYKKHLLSFSDLIGESSIFKAFWIPAYDLRA